MIPQEIKHKLKLIHTGQQTGTSYRNNCEIMFSEVLFCHFADCDFDGNKLDKLYMIYTKKNDQWRTINVTEELINDSSVETIKEFVIREIKSLK